MEEKKLTGYPSIDKPWLKYYSEEAINAPLPECTMYDHIQNNNQDNLDRIALNFYGNTYSYRKLFQEIDKLAEALACSGVRRGDIVSVCMINSPEPVFLIYALNKLGAVANMMYATATPKELCEHINETGSKLLFTYDFLQDKVAEIIDKTGLQQVVVADLTSSMSFAKRCGARLLKNMRPMPLLRDDRFCKWNDFLKNKSCDVLTCRDAEAPAVIVYSGGTTGGAKGVVLSNRSIVSLAWQYLQGSTELSKEQRGAQNMPLYIAYGVASSLHVPLSAGMTLMQSIAGTETIAQLCRHRINIIMHGPFMWERFAEENKNLDLRFLTTPISGGDLLPVAAEERINRYLLAHNCPSPLLNGYGMSEVSSAVSVNHKNAYSFGSIGIPYIKSIIAAFDPESGEEMPYGKEGELCFNTPSVMKEYLNNREETENILRAHADGQVWVHSGDLGYVDENGFVFFCGRLKRYLMVVRDGVYKKVFSMEIEKVLLTHPDVENCVVVPISDEECFQLPKAYIIARDCVLDKMQMEASLRKHCEEHLDDVYRPVGYEFVDAFPRTRIGKVDYRALEQMDLNE